MELSQYDGKCVRITDPNGDVFDGICSYSNEAFCEHEYGRNEECLKIVNFLFFSSDIKSVESLERHAGPYGKFLDPYGKLEELTVEDGIDSIRDVLFSEENEHVLRLLNCLDRYLDPYFDHVLACHSEVLDALKELLLVNKDENIQKKTAKLLRLWG